MKSTKQQSQWDPFKPQSLENDCSLGNYFSLFPFPKPRHQRLWQNKDDHLSHTDVPLGVQVNWNLESDLVSLHFWNDKSWNLFDWLDVQDSLGKGQDDHLQMDAWLPAKQLKSTSWLDVQLLQKSYLDHVNYNLVWYLINISWKMERVMITQ